MKNDLTNFGLKLVFQKWGILPVSIAGLGIGGSVVGHVGTQFWNIKYTIALIIAMILLSVIAKAISFAYQMYTQAFPRICARKLIEGDGLYKGNSIIVFDPDLSIRKGQLLTMICSSSGTAQPISIVEVINSEIEEIHPVIVGSITTYSLKKYFEEESRLKALYATPQILADNLKSSNEGENNG